MRPDPSRLLHPLPLALAGLALLLGLGLWLIWGGGTLEQVRGRGALVVLTRHGPTTYYEAHDEPAGPEYDLTQAFADWLGVKARYVVIDGLGELFEALAEGRGDLIAAGITRTEIRENHHRFGPDYQSIQQQVVCRRDSALPEGPADLVGRRLRVVADSSYVETLQAWQAGHPDLAWEVSDDLATEQLLAQVWERDIDCTLADSNILAINRRYYPELEVAFPASEEQPLAWVLRPESSALAGALDDWLPEAEADGTLARVMERYYGHVDLFDYVDVSVYRRRIGSRLPRFRALFKKTAERYGLPWTLLAAQAYQESHWDPKAKSPTGVRGLMMLTRNTARAMGVSNRLDPAASVRGGARYLARMRDALPETVQGEDRLWQALAAYNIGMGHLRDARGLAERLGRDPDAWYELKEVLPLLAQKRHYRDLPHGYARGSEPVRYVQRVREYQDILRHQMAQAVTP